MSNITHKCILAWLLFTKATNANTNDVKDQIRSLYEKWSYTLTLVKNRKS